MPPSTFDLDRVKTLAVLVETVTIPILMSHPTFVCLEVDIDENVPIPAAMPTMVELIRTLTEQILRELPRGGDLVITACETPRSIELEFADNGGDMTTRPCSIPMAVGQAGATLRWQNCPQGGVAATVVFPRRFQRQRRVA